MPAFKKLSVVWLVLSLLSLTLLGARFLRARSEGATPAEALSGMTDVSQLHTLVKNTPLAPASSKVGVGLLLLQKGKTDEAEGLFKEALQQDPENTDAMMLLGKLYRDQSNSEDALLYLEKAAQMKTSSADVHNELALAYEALGRYDDAVVEFRIAHEKDPNNAVIAANLEDAEHDAKRRAEIPVTGIQMPVPGHQTAPPVSEGIRIDAQAPIQPEVDHVFQRPLRITLKNGRSLVGDIVEKNDQELWLEVASGMKTKLSREDVIRIEDAETPEL